MRRITVHVDDPGALAAPPEADAAVGIYFGGPDGPGRTYSIRALRDGGAALEVEVCLHSHGPGADWATRAQPGDRVLLDHPNSWHRPPPDAGWQLLIADLAGLPALCRIVEELPAAGRAIVVVEVIDDADLALLPSHPGVSLHAADGGNGQGPSGLVQMAAGLAAPDSPGYLWFAGESGQARLARKHFRALGWTPDRYDITGYWRADAEAWNARFAPVAEAMMELYRRAVADGASVKAAMEAVDDALEREGL